jgi:plastocyanin
MIVLVAVAAMALSPGISRALMHDVEIHDNFFSPPAITVAEGDSVRWTHMGNNPHTVDQSIAEDSCEDLEGGFESEILMNGDTFMWVAAGIGDAYYKCDFHCLMGMVGEVTVEETTPVETASWGTVKSLYR